jgi:4-hydroxybenzoate polyprenyltransferase
MVWTGITASAALYFFFQLNVARQIVLAASMLLSVLYGIPCVPFKGKLRPLRQLPYVKTILVALTWMLTTAVTVYASNWPITLRPQDILLCLFVFTFILGLTIPFDIRDAKWDKEIELPTIAHLLGVKRTRQLALAMLIVYLLLGFGLFIFLPCYINYPAFFRSYYLAAFVAVLFGGIGGYIIVQKIDENSPDHYFTFRIDGMIIIQSIGILLILSLDRWM